MCVEAQRNALLNVLSDVRPLKEALIGKGGQRIPGCALDAVEKICLQARNELDNMNEVHDILTQRKSFMMLSGPS